MKQFTLLLATATALLSGVVSAHPGHGAAAGQNNNEVDLIRNRAVLNSTSGTLANDTSNTDTNSSVATDHIPIFKTADCVCPAAVCDPRMNAQSICECKAQAQLACYIKSSGGCPQPADNACA